MFSDSAFRKLHYKRYRLLPCMEKGTSIILALPPEPVIEAEDIIKKFSKTSVCGSSRPGPHTEAPNHTPYPLSRIPIIRTPRPPFR